MDTEEAIKKQYTLHFILHSSVNQDGADFARGKINQKIEAQGGKIEASICQDASRKFAYPINKQLGGYFCESVFSAPSESIKTLSDDLKNEPQVIRYMVEFKKPMKFRAKRSRLREAGARYGVAEARREKPRTVAGPPSYESEAKPVRGESKVPANAVTDKREKISMEEIDKKLDEIIKNI